MIRQGRSRGRWIVSIWIPFLVLSAAAGHGEDFDWLSIEDGIGAPHALESASIEAVAGRLDEWVDSGFGFVEVAWRTHVRIKAASEVEVRQSVVRLFVNDAGAQQAGTIEITIETDRSSLRVERAYLLLPDGRRQAVDPDSVQVTDSQDPDLFSTLKTVSLPMGGVVPGSVAFVEYTLIRRIEGDPLPWSSLFNMQTLVPILSNEIVVENEREPGWFDWATNDPGLECGTVSAGRLVCRRSEMAAVRLDPAVRSYLDVIPHFVVGQRVTWRELSARVAGLVEAKLDVSDEMEKAIARIREEFEEPEARARELYRVVSNQVRYLGFEHGDAAVVPRPASLTWKRRFGDCKDKVTLFVAMARALDLEVTPVLTSVSFFEPGTFVLPAASYFDHMIVCSDALPRDGGCVDVTLSSSPPGLPFVLQGGVALELTRRGADSIRPLPRRAALWEFGVTRDIRLECDGGIREKVDYRQGGPWGETLRSMLVQLSPDEREQYLANEYAQAMGVSEQRPEMELGGLASVGRPWTVHYASTRAQRAEMKGAQHFYDVNRWLLAVARSLVSENRHHDYAFPGIRLEAVSRYRLCEEAEIEYEGAALDLASRWGSLTRRYETRNDEVIVRSMLSMDSRVVSPSENEDLRLYLSRSLDQSAIQFGYRVD